MTRWIGLGALALLACDSESLPRKDYNDFRSRTESNREIGEVMEGESQLQDLTGRWLMHANLQGGIRLGLVPDFTPTGTVAEGEVPRSYSLKVWLHDQDVPLTPCTSDGECGERTCNRFGVCESAPLVITTTEVADDGSFEIELPLNLPPEVVGTEDPIIADVLLKASTTDANAFCGSATGGVTSPLAFELTGSTFGATRFEPAQLICQVTERDESTRPCATPEEEATGDNYDHVYRMRPAVCAAGEGAGGAGGEGGGMGGEGGEGGMGGDPGPQRPESPDLSAVESAPRNLTGTYLLTARVNGAIPLQLWLSLVHTQGADAGSLDGALRSVMDLPGDEALETFTTSVDAEGRFEVWLPELAVATDLATVQANLLLGAATVADGICGRATGEVQAPIMTELTETTTFFATPWEPGTDLPEDAPTACP